MRKYTVAGLVSAGIVLTGVSFGILQGNATAGSDAPAPQTPGTVVETTGQQPAVRQYARRGGCGSRCGQSVRRSCCSTPTAQAAEEGAQQGAGTFEMDPTVPLERYGAYLAEIYSRKLGGPVEVELKDYGCHQEAQVTRGGKLLKRLSISSGFVTEIG